MTGQKQAALHLQNEFGDVLCGWPSVRTTSDPKSTDCYDCLDARTVALDRQADSFDPPARRIEVVDLAAAMEARFWGQLVVRTIQFPAVASRNATTAAHFALNALVRE